MISGTVTDTNFLGQLGYVHKGRSVSAFVFGVPSIVAVVINYLKGRRQRGFPKSYFAGRFDVAGVRCFGASSPRSCSLQSGSSLALIVLIAAAVWAIYRIARGWLALRDRGPMYTSGGVRI